MNENQPDINTADQIQTPPPQKQSVSLEQIKLLAKDVFLKIYSNKKIFYPLAIALGLVFITMIIGIIFGSKTSAPQVMTFVKPTPPSISINTATQSADPLTTIQGTLDNLNNQINAFDVKQNRLQPPTLNFNISF